MTSNKPSMLRDEVFGAAAELFGVLASPCRVRILFELCKTELNVGELLRRVGGSQPNLSHHLNALYRAGVLARRREGARVFYRLASGKAAMLCDAMQTQCEGRSEWRDEWLRH